MKSGFLSAITLSLLCLLPLAPVLGQTNLTLKSRPLHLNPEDKSQQRIGDLVWRGGIAVTAANGDFGGLSDLLIEADGERFAAITDAGHWLRGRLLYDAAGNLTGVAATGFARLSNLNGRPLDRKRNQDAESMTALADGSLVVGFEREHRLWRFPAAGDPTGNALAGRPSVFPMPARLTAASLNAGVEALVALNDGRLLAFTEGQAVGENYGVYLWEKDRGWKLLTLKPRGLFKPTGAARLPDGDILLLERRFTLLGGLGMRLRRIAAETVRPGAVLEGEEIAELRPPLTVDNFEGVAVHRAGDGSLRLTLISDDNFSPLQRSLIVQFELQPQG